MGAAGARRVLAGLWVLDGLLQLLPRMFTMFMVQSVLRPPVLGEPTWLAHITQAILIGTSQHLVVFNLALAAVQVGLGIALLVQGGDRTWPYWCSLVWCAGVWVFGEALGGILTGQGSLVTGAPGAVVLYAVLTWAAWPESRPGGSRCRRRSVAAVLAGLWAFGAVLQAFPALFTAAGLSEMLLGNANSYQPQWVNALMRWGAAGLGAHPVAANASLIVILTMIGAGIGAGDRLRRIALAGSIVLSTLAWVFGQAFGMLLMAMTTDPNSAPLFVVLALYVWPETWGSAPLPGGDGVRTGRTEPTRRGSRGLAEGARAGRLRHWLLGPRGAATLRAARGSPAFEWSSRHGNRSRG